MLNFEMEGLTIKVEYDDNCFDPRAEYDMLGTMLCAHNRYTLGDETFNTGYYSSWTEVLKNEVPSKSIVLPVYMYEHSGIRLDVAPFSCRFDSGQVGFIYVEKAAIYKEFNVKRISKKLHEHIIQILTNEVTEYSNYLDGNVFWYGIHDKDGEYIDSCGGFIGSDLIENGLYDYLSYYIQNKDELKKHLSY